MTKTHILISTRLRVLKIKGVTDAPRMALLRLDLATGGQTAKKSVQLALPPAHLSALIETLKTAQKRMKK